LIDVGGHHRTKGELWVDNGKKGGKITPKKIREKFRRSKGSGTQRPTGGQQDVTGGVVSELKEKTKKRKRRKAGRISEGWSDY